MAYWWVSQGDTYAKSRETGILWAPAPDTGDTFHWRNLDRVQAGDVCFCYRNKQFLAIAIAESPRVLAPRPSDWPSKTNWNMIGRLIRVAYSEFPKPIDLSILSERLRRTLSAPKVKYGPLDSALNANEGYMFSINTLVGEELLRLAGLQSDPEAVDTTIIDSISSPTEREAVAKARIRQGQFRDDLLEYWHGKCAVTGLHIKSLLTASHIKPWRSSNHIERLDHFNGLLLSPAYDAVFDQHLVTFDEDGLIRIGPQLDVVSLHRLGIDAAARVSLTNKHQAHLSHHRALFEEAAAKISTPIS